MKVTNWCKKLRMSLVAAGILIPGAAYAQSITLGDPSFEVYTVPPFPGGNGFAYAQPIPAYGYTGAYRPPIAPPGTMPSAWVDDLDSPAGYIQDDSDSNWLYNAAYAEDGSAARNRAAPRTGTQAMHGLFNYNAQETGAVFEASKKYTYQIWAQGDDDATGASSRVFLYIFDGNVPFSEANALTFKRFGVDTSDFLNRTVGMTAVQSQANWRQVTLEHVVLPGAPEVGHPVGVGFWMADDGAVDDATLSASVINPEDFAVFLEVNTLNGQTAIKNRTGESVHIDYYEITSAGGSLHATNWNSFQEPAGNPAGFPSGDGSGNGWEEFGNVNSNIIGESYLTGSSEIPHSFVSSITLGAAFRTGMPQDLVFQYGQLSDVVAPPGDFNGDMVVDTADYVALKKANNTPEAYNLWRQHFGETAQATGPSTLVRGFVEYVTSGPGGGSSVPEPAAVMLVGMGLASLSLGGRRRSGDK